MNMGARPLFGVGGETTTFHTDEGESDAMSNVQMEGARDEDWCAAVSGVPDPQLDHRRGIFSDRMLTESLFPRFD
jgi:hypothetical protein